ncbi:MAG: hypothetical protein KAG66_14960, partial [Methylococcales bacterium]|nr:hypothetical protein [Methylococcales bacterium]
MFEYIRQLEWKQTALTWKTIGSIILLGLLTLVQTAHAQSRPIYRDTIPLAEVLTSDGILAIPEGMYGNIDLSGYQLSGGLTGTPTFTPKTRLPPP